VEYHYGNPEVKGVGRIANNSLVLTTPARRSFGIIARQKFCAYFNQYCRQGAGAPHKLAFAFYSLKSRHDVKKDDGIFWYNI
jgi:hypothetical protein